MDSNITSGGESKLSVATTRQGSLKKFNITFIKSQSCALYMGELIFGILFWALLANPRYRYSVGCYSYLMFVGMFAWLLTMLVFFYMW